VGLREKITK